MVIVGTTASAAARPSLDPQARSFRAGNETLWEPRIGSKGRIPAPSAVSRRTGEVVRPNAGIPT